MRTALKTGDHEKIIPLMNEMYHKNQERARTGKKPIERERASLELAKKALEDEISFVMKIDNVKKFIADRIENKR